MMRLAWPLSPSKRRIIQLRIEHAPRLTPSLPVSLAAMDFGIDAIGQDFRLHAL